MRLMLLRFLTHCCRVSHSALGAEQKADPSLSQMFETVLSKEAERSAAGGYLLQEGLMVRKCSPHVVSFAGKPVFQIFILASFKKKDVALC